MVATLFLVGSGREAPSLVDSLLDVQQCPARPCYDMAPDAPLLLHSIGYPEARLRWTPHADESLSAVAALWRREAEAATLRSAMLLTMRSSLLSARRPTADGVEAKAATHEAKRARREARQQAEAAAGGTRD
ncbi:hypothetical protein EMIHUDRAFT_246456 [Emiliania huxleyi CCMP1516]|nr:hypothetical protein EMIHUDRAFT_246456 [Emiliania huxleyi CCMP1516]EOD14022.1 hypothetical protein EMIHUDRAFT_246456 [Emiliania huxleyi CCMP1516]|eukprot:XP_005766451.1 hypothetical protein EMIHUDRAFT_246456 [Emiliania huxleyi CCMP1516]